MSEGANAYRDELAASQARIAALEADVHSAIADDAAMRWIAELRARREAVAAEGRRFSGLGPDGLGAIAVATVLLAAGVAGGLLQGALFPTLAGAIAGALFVAMIVAALRSGRRAHVASEVCLADARIAEATRVVSLVRVEGLRRVADPLPARVGVEPGSEPEPEQDEAALLGVGSPERAPFTTS